jgi:Ca-activated chloride channel family protein
MIEQERESGIFLTVLGFGMGNYKDDRMQQLADHGNGNHAYIDNINEARKIFVHEFSGTLFTIAKDVKIQVEFNPAKVQSYRLIGYENRLLAAQDFNDDQKDAGEIGAGHTVTALYEIIPVGVQDPFSKPIDHLKYQHVTDQNTNTLTDEWLTIKFRYKAPDGVKSKLIEQALTSAQLSSSMHTDNFNWSAAIAAFGMILRESEYKGTSTVELVRRLASKSIGSDSNGYRAEFLGLIDQMDVVASRE